MSNVRSTGHTPSASSGAFPKLIPVLYQDDLFVVFDKPAGLLVIPTEREKERTLVQMVNQQYRSSDQDPRFYPCHRLDRETSGVIIFGKGKRAQQLMMAKFQSRQVEKTYIAFVQGQVKTKAGEIRTAVEPVQPKRRPTVGAKPACTRYKVIQRKAQFTVIEARPLTGRTNQIRIHFRDIGHPLVGDRKYSIAKNYPLQFRRTALHASTISWYLKESKQTVVVESHLPNDMEVFCERN